MGIFLKEYWRRFVPEEWVPLWPVPDSTVCPNQIRGKYINPDVNVETNEIIQVANNVVRLTVGLGVKNLESPFEASASIASPDFKPEVQY